MTGSSYGEIFTRRWVVDVLLDLTGFTADIDLGALHLLEPSCGSGAFLKPAIERLLQSAINHGRNLHSLGDAIRAYDLQQHHVDACRKMSADLLVDAGLSPAAAAKIATIWVVHADFLLTTETDHADVVIGNPPYIRYDHLQDDLAAQYRATWPTMRGRGDIYVGFIERALRLLKPGGKVGYICADRWMRNQYGSALRELIADRYAVEHVWTLHDVDAFEEQVSAYPAITVLANHEQESVVVADTTADFGPSAAFGLAKAARDPDFQSYQDIGVTAHRLPHWFRGSELWPTGSPARLALIEHLNDRFAPLQDPATGTKVSIGIATGADQVYVTKDPSLVEADRMMPLATSRDLATGTFTWQGNYLVNPWADDGSLVDLADYPRMASYLRKHPVLKRRFVAKKEPESWYRTIDKAYPGLIDRPKLLLQDMKAAIHPVLEPGGHYPHHALYYIVSDTWDLEVLGGLLLSSVAQAFIEAYCVKMRGGTLRFQAQYLRRIRVPDPTTLDPRLADALRVAFRNRDVNTATTAAILAYNIDPSEFDLPIRDVTTTSAERGTNELPDHIEDPTQAAVSLFWTKRADQMSKLADGGAAGGAARAAGHMSGIRDLVSHIFIEAGLPATSVVYEPYLPGYYRARKKWDMAVRYKGALVAAMEFKSQVGSVGKNINNRFEEALGTATDTWAAQNKFEAYGDVPPWLGYVFVLREDEETEAPNRPINALFPADESFAGLSYNGRYQEMLRRFLGDNIYQAGWFITTKVDSVGKVSYAEPLATATGKAFRTAVEGRVNYVKSVLG